MLTLNILRIASANKLRLNTPRCTRVDIVHDFGKVLAIDRVTDSRGRPQLVLCLLKRVATLAAASQSLAEVRGFVLVDNGKIRLVVTLCRVCLLPLNSLTREFADEHVAGCVYTLGGERPSASAIWEIVLSSSATTFGMSSFVPPAGRGLFFAMPAQGSLLLPLLPDTHSHAKRSPCRPFVTLMKPLYMSH